MRDGDVDFRLLHGEDGLEEDRAPFLDKLAKGMEVGGEGRRIGEEAGVVLALGFAK